MMKCVIPLLLAVTVLPSSLLASETAAAPSSVHSVKPASDYFLQFSMLSSKSGQKNDFRSLKGSASDDTGGMSESTSIPNLSYAAGVGILKFQENHRFVVAALQSLDSRELRTIPTPFGRNFVIPGQIFALKYSYAVAPNWRLSAGGAYIDVFRFTDPSAGVTYRRSAGNGLSYRMGVDFAAPINAKSKRDHLITRTTARSGAYLRKANWSAHGSLSHSVPFFRAVSATPGAISHGSVSHGAGGPGGMPAMGQIEEIDLVLSDREVSRTMTSIGGSFSLSDSVSLSTGFGITYLRTARNTDIWMSNMKPIGAKFSMNKMEVGTNLTLNSDIQNYQRLSLPRLWNVDVTVSYFFGQHPREM